MGTAALAASLRAAGCAVRALKPLASGGPPPSRDATRLDRAASHAPAVNPCSPTAAAPHRAAHIAGDSIDPAAVRRWMGAQMGPIPWVEGVGGWRVRLAGTGSMADLAVDLALPVVVVVVAADRLGVLGHPLRTVEAIRARGLVVAGVVLVDPASTTRPAPPSGWRARRPEVSRPSPRRERGAPARPWPDRFRSRAGGRRSTRSRREPPGRPRCRPRVERQALESPSAPARSRG